MSNLHRFQIVLTLIGFWFINITGLFIPLLILIKKFKSKEPLRMFTFRYWY